MATDQSNEGRCPILNFNFTIRTFSGASIGLCVLINLYDQWAEAGLEDDTRLIKIVLIIGYENGKRIRKKNTKYKWTQV